MRIVIAGAGSVGCFVGGLLVDGDHDVTMLGRPRILDEIREHGLTLTDYAGLSLCLTQDRLELAGDPVCLGQADLVLVTVKAPATAGMAAQIARYAPDAAPVVSLQNGIDSADILRATLPGRDVRAGMVAFNVVPMRQGRFHRASSGGIQIGAGPGGLAARLSVPGLSVGESPDIVAIQWGKLLLNLTNALNALSGLPLRQMMLDLDWRRLMAAQMAEALVVLRAAGIAVRSTTPVPVWAGPHVLRLPTPLFTRIAARALVIDPEAMTSMAQDLVQGRPTEIDSLQGMIIALGRAQGLTTPIADRVADAIRQAEAQGAGRPHLCPGDLAGGRGGAAGRV